MNLEHYKSQIGRLIEVFGDKYFPQERQKIMWEKCKFDEDEQFTRAVNKIILDKVHVPAASEILAYVANEKPSHKSFTQFYDFDCSWCGQSGFVTAKAKPPRSGHFAFRCQCTDFSYKAKGNFVRWTKEMALDLDPQFYHFDRPGDTPYKIKHRSYEPTSEQKESLKTFVSFVDASNPDKEIYL